MKDQFDIWRFDFPGKGEHSVILISHPDVCARASFVNVLYCTSQRQNRPPKPCEVMLPNIGIRVQSSIIQPIRSRTLASTGAS